MEAISTASSGPAHYQVGEEISLDDENSPSLESVGLPSLESVGLDLPEHKISAVPDADTTPPTSSSSERQRPNIFEDAFPTDSMQNGISAAKSFMSWGFGKVRESVREGATKVRDLSNSEFAVAETERFSEMVERTGQIATQGANEAQRLAGVGFIRAKSGLEQLQQEIQASPTVEAAREKAAVMAEQAKPKLQEAGETAKTSFVGAMRSAANAAIWFQSLGATKFDSDDEVIYPQGTNSTSSDTFALDTKNESGQSVMHSDMERTAKTPEELSSPTVSELSQENAEPPLPTASQSVDG